MSKRDKSSDSYSGEESSEDVHTIIAVQPGKQRQSSRSIPSDSLAGLEHLSTADHLFVKQHVEMTEVIFGFEIANKYSIFNEAGKQIFMALEESKGLTRQLLKSKRAYTMHIMDGQDQEVIRCKRPYKCGSLRCCAGCCDSCTHETTIEAPPGNVIGVVRQTTSWCGFDFVVEDNNGRCIFTINCPTCVMCCGDFIFKIHSPGNEKALGSIRKQWGGMMKEGFTKADNYGVNFPIDLDVNKKALLLGAVFLIDFMAFEGNGR